MAEDGSAALRKMDLDRLAYAAMQAVQPGERVHGWSEYPERLRASYVREAIAVARIVLEDPEHWRHVIGAAS